MLVPKTLYYPVISISGILCSGFVFKEENPDYEWLWLTVPMALLGAIISYNWIKHGHELGNVDTRSEKKDSYF